MTLGQGIFRAGPDALDTTQEEITISHARCRLQDLVHMTASGDAVE